MAFAAVSHRLGFADIRTGDEPIQRHRDIEHDLAHRELLRTLGAVPPVTGRNSVSVGLTA